MNRFVLSEPTTFGRIDRPTTHRQVHLSDLRGVFADEAGWQRLVDADNPLVYEVFLVEPERPQPSDLSYGTTILHAGQVGGEYFLTKGHLHMPSDRPELYYVLGGAGVLILAEVTPSRDLQVTERVSLHPGLVAYVEGRYAHRVVNTGAVDLVFFSVWPSDTGHDYETVLRHGIGARVMG